MVSSLVEMMRRIAGDVSGVVPAKQRVAKHVSYRTGFLAAFCAIGMLVGPARAQSGLPSRPSNPTCVAPDRPLTGTAAVVTFPGTFFAGSQPTAMQQLPNDPTVWYVSLKTGFVERVVWDQNNPGTPVITHAINLSGKVVSNSPEAGLSGMVLHPQFQSGQPFVYLHYSGPNTPGATGPFTEYISRFTSFDGGMTFDPASEQVMLTLPQGGIFHHGGKMVFGPDGYFYLGFGDGGFQAEAESQDLFSLIGKVLRIDVNSAFPYAIPPTNPFAAGGGAPEIWALGMRNPFQFSFDRVTGDLWAGDVGWNTWEEVDLILPGKNYGWPIMEGNHCVVEPCDPSPFEPPVVEYLHSTLGGDGLAIIGGYVYRGSAIPQLYGRYVYGDFNGNVWALTTNEAGTIVPEFLRNIGSITGFYEDAQGELYALGSPIHKIVPLTTPPASPFPQTISASGCRAPGNPTQPAAGVIPYNVNVELWSDGAAKNRWMGVPDGRTIDILPDGDWSFPIGTILMKDFSVQGVLTETRLFIRHNDGGWAGYSYQWNAQGTDANLLPGSATAVVGGQTWNFPSRTQCLSCHTAIAGSSLGPTTAQMNGDFLYPSTGITANQLTTLSTIGMFTAPGLPGPPNTLPILPGPNQTNQPLNLRARGYLQANCAHCHAPGGPTQAAMDLRFGVSEADANICGIPPNLGDLGIPGALLLAPAIRPTRSSPCACTPSTRTGCRRWRPSSSMRSGRSWSTTGSARSASAAAPDRISPRR